MAVTYEGYDYVQASGALSDTIDIPAGTDYVLCSVQGYAYSSLSSVTVDGDAMSLIAENHGTSDCFLFGLTAPSVGNSLAVASNSGAWGEGVTYFFTFWSDVDQSNPIIDSGAFDADSGTVTDTLAAEAGCGVFVGGFGNTPPTLSGNSQTVIDDQIFYRSQNGGGAYKIVTSGTTTQAGTGGNNYGTMVCCTINEATGGTPVNYNVLSEQDQTGAVGLLVPAVLSSRSTQAQTGPVVISVPATLSISSEQSQADAAVLSIPSQLSSLSEQSQEGTVSLSIPAVLSVFSEQGQTGTMSLSAPAVLSSLSEQGQTSVVNLSIPSRLTVLGEQGQTATVELETVSGFRAISEQTQEGDVTLAAPVLLSVASDQEQVDGITIESPALLSAISEQGQTGSIILGEISVIVPDIIEVSGGVTTTLMVPGNIETETLTITGTIQSTLSVKGELS